MKDLAAANIFPGDMLLNNFGVTRHGRVIFYDYAEITNLTNCTIRSIPEPPFDVEAVAADPWYGVAKDDVFPAEFAQFTVPRGELGGGVSRRPR